MELDPASQSGRGENLEVNHNPSRVPHSDLQEYLLIVSLEDNR